MTNDSWAGRPWTGARDPAGWRPEDGQAVKWEDAPALESREIVPLERPEWIAAFLEMKTVWRSIGL